MSAIPSYKDIVDLIKKGATLEAQEKIIQLREACIELEDETHAQKKKIRELEDALRFKDSLNFKAPFYFSDKDAEPYCPRCWEKDRAGIHLGSKIQDDYIYVRPCPECKASYKVGEVTFNLG